MSFPSMVSLMSLVINVLPMGITVSMVGGGTMLPMLIGYAACFDCPGHSPYNLDDHCVYSVLMGSVAFSMKIHFSLKSLVKGFMTLSGAIGVVVGLLVGKFSLQYLGILLSQEAVLDKMAVAATFETNLLSDHIDVTI